MYDITVPTLNTNDTEYVLLQWYAGDGERVDADQPVALVETSKATEDLYAGAPGLLHRDVPVGARFAPGTVIGRVYADEAQRPTDHGTGAPAPSVPDDLVLTDSARALVERHGIAPDRLRSLGRRLIRGTDVEALVAQGSPVPDPAPDPAAAGDVLVLSPVQRAVAATVESGARVPAAFTAVKVYPADLTTTGIAEQVIVAVAGLRERYPAFFARLVDAGTALAAPGAQIGVTVDVGHGLYLPVVRDAHTMDVTDVATALLRLRVKAVRGTFSAGELAGANIGVTLHTESAVLVAQPVIHPGHTAAVAVCAPQRELALAPDGTPVYRDWLTVGVAYDHRVVNGRDAVLFLDAVKQRLEGSGASG